MHWNQQLATQLEHFCTKLLTSFKELDPKIFLALLHDNCWVGM